MADKASFLYSLLETTAGRSSDAFPADGGPTDRQTDRQRCGGGELARRVRSAGVQTNRWWTNGETGREAKSQTDRRTDGQLAGGQTDGRAARQTRCGQFGREWKSRLVFHFEPTRLQTFSLVRFDSAGLRCCAIKSRFNNTLKE